MATAKKAAPAAAAVEETATPAVEAESEFDELKRELEILRAEKALREEAARLKAEAEEAEAEARRNRGPREPLRLQSRYTGFHSIQLVPHTRKIHATLGIVEPVPGVYATFEGKQRLFDSARAQEKFGWDDDTTDAVERMLVLNDGFMTDYFPAPMSTVPEHLLAIAKTKPPTLRKKCQGFGFNSEGDLEQCAAEPMAGDLFCEEHTPDATRILHGGGTTRG